MYDWLAPAAGATPEPVSSLQVAAGLETFTFNVAVSATTALAVGATVSVTAPATGKVTLHVVRLSHAVTCEPLSFHTSVDVVFVHEAE